HSIRSVLQRHPMRRAPARATVITETTGRGRMALIPNVRQRHKENPETPMQNESIRENSQAADTTPDLAATAPGQLRVIKRNGTVVPYTDDKITVAITKAFLAVEGGSAAASSRIHDTVARLTEQVTATFKRRMPSGGTIHIEEIQDQVELALM